MQKLKRTIATSIVLAMGIVMIMTTTLFASPMKDVSTNHWAYNDIMEMQKRGLLLTNSQGEFFPNKYVTYFEFSQILAKATGYEDAALNPNMDPGLKESINSNYQKQKPVIEAHAKNYQHWQKDADKEIAYLLGRGYLTKEDLGKFMTKGTSGVESKRGVRRQEATAYLVRSLHKAETAKAEYVSTGFIDGDKIDAAYRPYVAYMKKIGIINGNQKGEFGPTTPITRATLSTMLIHTIKAMESEAHKPADPVKPVEPSDMALEGKFTKMISKGDGGYYLVLEVEPGKTQTYSIEPTASVTDKNGNLMTLESLKSKIDSKDNDVIVIARAQVIGVTEYITNARLINESNATVPEQRPDPKPDPAPNPKPEEKPEQAFTGDLAGTVYSVLMGPRSQVTVELKDRDQKKFEISLDTPMYHQLKRKQVFLWDLRLNQEVDLKIVDNVITSLKITKDAPPITVTGDIVATSVSGDQIEVRVSRDLTRKISVPMGTVILDGSRERGRKDLREGMTVVVIYDEEQEFIPSRIIILSQ